VLLVVAVAVWWFEGADLEEGHPEGVDAAGGGRDAGGGLGGRWA
jgi:hypothetical protein